MRYANFYPSAHSSESWNLVRHKETGSQIKFGMSGVRSPSVIAGSVSVIHTSFSKVDWEKQLKEKIKLDQAGKLIKHFVLGSFEEPQEILTKD